jgi:putative phosphoesterase
MVIGIISDTHDNLSAVQLVQSFFLNRGIKYVFHCGDLTNPSLIPYLSAWKVIFVAGNMDQSFEPIRQALEDEDQENWSGQLYTGMIHNSQIAMAHGNVEGQIEALIQSQKYDYVFHGHTHERRDERIGKTRVINPGPLGGIRSTPGSICVLDLDTDQATFYAVMKTSVEEMSVK